MKKLLYMSICLTAGFIHAEHLALKGTDRLDFAQKRLTMIEKKLEGRKNELVKLLESLRQDSLKGMGARLSGTQLATVRQEIADLEKLVEIMKNSLQALSSLLH